jgi:adenylosuccinate synthase
MPSRADIIVGIQWGDEGKGRIVDLYAAEYDVVARFGGGDNAGHRIVVGDTEVALRIVPSGVLNAHAELFIGGGTVVSLNGLLDELDRLAAIGVDVSRVKISDRAHVVLPYHAAADRANERARGAQAIGTTGRGIGPAYVDKAARAGILFGDLADRETLASKIAFNLAMRAGSLKDETLPSEADLLAQTLEAAERLLPHVVDGVDYIHERLEAGRRVLIEGAQGSLIDVGYGTYPFVTSSHTIAGGACTGLGIGPTAVGRVIGVVKAYCTRVGAGPFPSELHDAAGDRLRAQGGEFGHRPSAPVRLVRRGRRPLRRAPQRPLQRRHHETRRALGLRNARDRHRLPPERQARGLCRRRSRRPRMRDRRSAGLARADRRRPPDRRSPARRPKLRSTHRRPARSPDRPRLGRPRARRIGSGLGKRLWMTVRYPS